VRCLRRVYGTAECCKDVKCRLVYMAKVSKVMCCLIQGVEVLTGQIAAEGLRIFCEEWRTFPSRTKEYGKCNVALPVETVSKV